MFNCLFLLQKRTKKSNQTALHVACAEGFLTYTTMLLDFEADMNCADSHGMIGSFLHTSFIDLMNRIHSATCCLCSRPVWYCWETDREVIGLITLEWLQLRLLFNIRGVNVMVLTNDGLSALHIIALAPALGEVSQIEHFLSAHSSHIIGQACTSLSSMRWWTASKRSEVGSAKSCWHDSAASCLHQCKTIIDLRA